MPRILNWSAFQCKTCQALYKLRHHVEKHQKGRTCEGIAEMTVSLIKSKDGAPKLELKAGRAETSYE